MSVNPTLSAPTKRSGEKGGDKSSYFRSSSKSFTSLLARGSKNISPDVPQTSDTCSGPSLLRFSSPKLPLNPKIPRFKRVAKIKHKIKLEAQNKPRRSERIRNNHANFDFSTTWKPSSQPSQLVVQQIENHFVKQGQSDQLSLLEKWKSSGFYPDTMEKLAPRMPSPKGISTTNTPHLKKVKEKST